MSATREDEAFMQTLRSGKPCKCSRCRSRNPVPGEDCRLESINWLHPADVWTIRELRKLSINGSFR